MTAARHPATTGRPPTTTGRPRVTVLAALAALAAVTPLAACAGSGGGGSANSGGNAPTIYDVATQTETYTGTSEPPRSIVTTIWYPTTGGPFPLILFSHGGGTTGTSYSNLLTRIAERGYVVAAPNYPPGAGDVESRPADARSVITKVLDATGDPTHRLHNRIDRTHVGAMGHSQGGGTTLGFAFHSCCRDDRIRAAVLLASARPAYRGEPFPPPAVPGLVVHGDADERAPYAEGRRLYDEMQTPKYLVTVLGGDHTLPYSGEAQRPPARLVIEAVVAFFEAHLKGTADRVRRVVDAEPDVATLVTAA